MSTPIIIGLIAVLLIVFYTAGVPTTSDNVDTNESYQNYRPARNSFRNYFRRDTFQGRRVDWQPSLPYYHLTPEYGAYARQGAVDCLLYK